MAEKLTALQQEKAAKLGNAKDSEEMGLEHLLVSMVSEKMFIPIISFKRASFFIFTDF